MRHDIRYFHMPTQSAEDRFYAAGGAQYSEYLMSGTISGQTLNSNAAGTVTGLRISPGRGTNTDPRMDTASACEKIHMEPAKKGHERDWRELRQRLERKLAAAAAQAMNVRHEQGERRKAKWPLGGVTPQEKHRERRLFTVNSEDKFTVRAANPRTGVVSPSNRTESSQEDTASPLACRQKWKMKDDQWVSVDVSRSSSAQTPSSGAKLSMESQGRFPRDASSPMLTPDVLSDDWEDRFVVNMPSAKDPNPPTMTPQQIQEYQEIISRIRLERGTMQEAASEPSRRAVNSEDGSTPMLTQSARIGSKPAGNSPVRADHEPSVSPPSSFGKYFSPDEVGPTRVSPIQEGSQQKIKKPYDGLRDECFMGCMEIDRPHLKNPDEILLFPNMEDECRHSPLPSIPVSKKQSDRRKRLSEEEKAVVHEQIPPSLSTRLPLSSKRIASAPQKSNVQESLSQRAGKLAVQPPLTSSQTGIPRPATSGKENLVEEVNRKEDDGTTVTPPITRVMPQASIPKSTTEPSRLHQAQRAAGTSYAPIPPTSGTYMPRDANSLFMGHSKTAPTAEPAGIQGNSIHQRPGTSKQFTIVADSCAVPSPPSGNRLKLDTNNVFRDVPAATGPSISTIVSPAEERARNTLRARRGKPPSVAELDGLQVHQQIESDPVGGPAIEAEDSPQESNSKADPGSPENNRTPSIRVEANREATEAELAKLAEKRAEAQKAAEKLAEARKHAKRLAEARAAYKRAQAQKTASEQAAAKTAEERFKERKLAAEKLAEARATYRAAEAKKAAKNKAADEKATKRAGEEARAAEERKTAREKRSAERKMEAEKSAKEKGPPSPKKSKDRVPPDPMEGTTGDGKRGEGGVKGGVAGSGGLGLQNCSLLFHIVLLSLVQLHGFLRCNRMFHHLVLVSEKLFEMASHCFRVSKRLGEVWLTYKRTGSWPTSSSEELALLTRDVGQAVVYFVVLGFVVMVVGRAAGYIVLVASWIVWISRPFGWVFSRLGGVLFA